MIEAKAGLGGIQLNVGVQLNVGIPTSPPGTINFYRGRASAAGAGDASPASVGLASWRGTAQNLAPAGPGGR